MSSSENKFCEKCDKEIIDNNYVYQAQEPDDEVLFICKSCTNPFCHQCHINNISDLLHSLKFPCNENELSCQQCIEGTPPECVGYYETPTEEYCDRCGKRYVWR